MVALLIIQSVVQGITEFLPVSSSGHLVLSWSAAAWMGVDTSFSSAEMLTLNVALHVGTLFAVIIYFWRLVWAAVLGGVDLLRWRDTDNRRLFVFLVIASFPLMVAGLLVGVVGPDLWLLNALVVAGASSCRHRTVSVWPASAAQCIGVAPCSAVAPRRPACPAFPSAQSSRRRASAGGSPCARAAPAFACVRHAPRMER